MNIKIKHKLFSTLLLTGVVVGASLFFFLQWNFDRGFLNYVKSQELEQMDRLSGQLSAYYNHHGNWQFITQNHPLWQRLHTNALSPPQMGEGFGNLGRENRGASPSPPPGLMPPRDPRGLGPRIILFDADKKRIIGGPSSDVGKNLSLRPISYEEKVIGYLGLMPVREISYSGDLLFLEQQTESFILITVVIVALSLLLSYPVTIQLLRPINALTEGTRKLIAGQFKTRIPVTTGDELGRLSDDFNILAMTLEKNEHNRQQWVADISHELRTPLSVLRGEIEALQDGIRQAEPQTVDAIHREIMRFERLVGDLYELSMSDIGALNYKYMEVNPVGILQETTEMFEQRFRQKELKLSTDLEVAVSSLILADPDRLQQLFANLLENSLRYTDAPGRLEVKLEREKDYLAIHFLDSCPGVSSGQLPKLFDRLYRVERSRNRGTGGVGLGLAICKNIVEAHQGRIEAGKSPLGGVWVKIKLPLSS
ncbi:MAG: ATP-binding protein [Desulforhopalus sp.]